MSALGRAGPRGVRLEYLCKGQDFFVEGTQPPTSGGQMSAGYTSNSDCGYIGDGEDLGREELPLCADIQCAYGRAVVFLPDLLYGERAADEEANNLCGQTFKLFRVRLAQRPVADR